MRLLPWRKDRVEEEELWERVTALQAALNTCKGVAQRWTKFRWTTTAALVALALVVGFVLGGYREELTRSARNMAAAVGLATPSIDRATMAFRSGHDARAAELARPRAEEGDAAAQALLGLIYSRAQSPLQNDAEGVKWLRLAADQGDASARYALGLLAEEGRGLPQDDAEAARWLRLAAEQGYPLAQLRLARSLADGKGEADDYVNAHMWFNLAAARFPGADNRNRTAATRGRDEVAARMSAEQIAEAQRRAREWKPK